MRLKALEKLAAIPERVTERRRAKRREFRHWHRAFIIRPRWIEGELVALAFVKRIRRRNYGQPSYWDYRLIRKQPELVAAE